MEASSDASGNHSIDENNLDVASLAEINEVCQLGQDTVKETPHHQELSTSSQNPTAQEEDPWNIIIVNQIPKAAIGPEILPFFSEYGAITDVCLPVKKLNCRLYRHDGFHTSKHKGFAQLTFENEASARRVWEDSQEGGIRYYDHTKSYVMMITLASRNYTPIDNLPDDCLHEIFRHLSSLKDRIALDLVCRRWKKVARESWSNVTEVKYSSNPDFSWKVILARAGKYLRMIKISLTKDTAERLSLLVEHCENLEQLEITLPEDLIPFLLQLNVFLQKNERLRRLFIKFHHVSPYSYNSNLIVDISFMQHVPATLEEIHLSKGRYPLAPLELSRFQNLQVLEIVDTPIRENDLRGIETLQNLKELTLRDCAVHPSNVERIIGLTKLESVDISECSISDSILSKIVENNKGLRNLEINDGCW